MTEQGGQLVNNAVLPAAAVNVLESTCWSQCVGVNVLESMGPVER